MLLMPGVEPFGELPEARIIVGAERFDRVRFDEVEHERAERVQKAPPPLVAVARPEALLDFRPGEGAERPERVRCEAMSAGR